MTTDLTTFQFTNKADLAQDLIDGLFLLENEINTLGGNDTIEGNVETIGNGDLLRVIGIDILGGIIYTDNGKDSIIGKGFVSGDSKSIGADGINLSSFGNLFPEINTSKGNDYIYGEGNIIGNGSGNGIFINEGIINTGSGNDTVIGKAHIIGNSIFSNGIFIDGAISTSLLTEKGVDRIEGEVTITGDSENSQAIFAGDLKSGTGNDSITGRLSIEKDAINNSAIQGISIFTGDNNDQIIGTILIKGNGSFNYGISSGTFNAGNGNDFIMGEVKINGDGDFNSGIINRSTFNPPPVIDTGEGNDILIGKASVKNSGSDNFGIFNDMTSPNFQLGNGNDQLIGIGPDDFTGFGGSGAIDLGNGNDKVTGFGDQIIFGGHGFDTAKFNFDFDDTISLGMSSTDADIEITANGITMSFNSVERFWFANTNFSLHDLQHIIV